ncbi:PAP2 superfamily protein [Sporothrix brasiliensis 5110]|uniref:PAP2 superfamily protein n=1 Tax=Sporothrix brasiliensis 5110 TaxID=1398154 RepID=A0A0C2ES74_9PEZI|nr:PAP2 superfamily protein [Sporothrix brasiliensis 5110]KIH89184.1 PAP2 superfamily protein [Sporothrix brasiliensis 5110]
MSGATSIRNGAGRSDAGPDVPTIKIAEEHGHGHEHGHGDGDVVDAGLKSLDHYKRALPKWRYRLRQRLLPLVRWETPYLAYFQNALRSPALDSYFAITANLGTHTFFMIGLPMLFWFDYAKFGKGLVHILASGVFFSGFIKDMCSLPRPLSPPLHRITMSDSVALEYGFPSTHSTNAVSVAVYAVLMLSESDLAPSTKLFLESLSYFYAFSIIVGRLYCGMHGFFDVVIGSVLGAVISWIEFYWVPALDAYMLQSSWWAPIIAALIIIVLVRIHPEPADDCPCFDDSVAFAGVMIGLEIGTWHIGRLRNTFSLLPGGIASPSWPIALARVVFGVLVVFAWREVMKPTLLKVLPFLFRVIETHGLNLPRRFFVQASEYGKIPEVLLLRTDNVIPSVSDIPIMVRNIRNARRGRSISIGPQSAADAYETLAYRERRRRESIGSQGSAGVRSKGSMYDLRGEQGDGAAASAVSVGNGEAVPLARSGGTGTSSGISAGGTANDRESKGRSASVARKNSLAQFEEMMGQGTVVEVPQSQQTTAFPRLNTEDDAAVDEPDLFVGRQDELGEREMFEKLVKPRVRYDVEVVTKLIVYAGKWIHV